MPFTQEFFATDDTDMPDINFFHRRLVVWGKKKSSYVKC